MPKSSLAAKKPAAGRKRAPARNSGHAIADMFAHMLMANPFHSWLLLRRGPAAARQSENAATRRSETPAARQSKNSAMRKSEIPAAPAKARSSAPKAKKIAVLQKPAKITVAAKPAKPRGSEKAAKAKKPVKKP